MDYALNIGGSEWIIIVFVVLVLVLGTGRLPDAAKRMGRAVNEYNRAKDEIRGQISGAAGGSPRISGPAESEREKLEELARSAGIKVGSKTDDELREKIASAMGQKRDGGEKPQA